MNIEFLGQAGLFIESSNCRLLCDPWFSNTGGFLATWHQFPPNEHLDTKKYYDADFLYISHSHEDHFDKEYLKKFPKDVNLLIAKRDIYEDEELTVDYIKQLYLEQPTGDWI